MTTVLMKSAQSTPPFAVALAAGRVQRIPAADHDRWLQVDAGQVWLTISSARGGDSDDVWCSAGEGALLPAGVEALIEARRQAAFHLQEALARRATASALTPLARWVHRERLLGQLGAHPDVPVQGLDFSAEDARRNW